MRTRRLFLPIVLVSLGCAIAVSACNPQEPSSQQQTPAVATEQTDDTLRMLYWQAPTILNPHLASGFKDYDGARMSYEPLASYDKNDKLVLFLAEEIPTQENGGLAEDGKSVTWKLKKDIKWSDGTPFTAEDVVFTYEYLSNPEVAAATLENYANIEKVEAIDPHTVKITFKDVTPGWSVPFTGQNGMILPKHIFENYNGANSREAAENLKPVGTGPYKVVEFKPGDIIILEPNEFFREGTEELFKRIELKGGGDATSAARAVLQTGDADYAYNLQVEAPILKELEAGGKGKVMANFGSYVERILLNFTDPNQVTEDGERSSIQFPHPFFSDPQVRQAFNFAIDRETISNQLYGTTARPTAQILVTPKVFASDKISYEFNLEKANQLLDEAGWKDTNNDGTRDKDGVEMKVIFQTSVNSVRQKTQEIVKQSLAEIGVDVELKSIDPGVFFSGDTASTDTVNSFYADLQMFSTGNDSPDPAAHMKWWTCDEVSQKENGWQKPNYARYCNPEYDELWQQAIVELDPAKRAELFKQMDELLAKEVALIPLVNRATVHGVSNRLTGIDPSPWDANTWDIKNWRKE
ncbi:peptide ABC transporter substrate-binding protein [Lusitaniella coriacea]|uniref:peptide ABC transporter substrate-binding protein n=1 Tax=Lusitaniella coriacea TaxID=1983105 RepID=UPI003CEC0D6A